MFEKNEKTVLEIISCDNRFYGVAKPNGFTVFVKDALPGEKVEALIIKSAKNYAVAKVLNRIKTSGERMEPECPYYSKCGGCSAMHICYAAQLKYKNNSVRDALERIGRFNNLKINPIIGSDNQLGYRNKIQLPVTPEGIGFYRRGSHSAQDISCCPVQQGETDKLIIALRKYMLKTGERPYDEKNGRGMIRHLVIRTNSDGEAYITLVLNGNGLKDEKLLTDCFSETGIKIAGIAINVNRRRDNVILGEDTRIIFGSNVICETLLDKKFEIAPTAFFQVNKEQTEKLYLETGRLLDLREGETLLDIYCGIGTIGISLYKNEVKVIGIEYVQDAVENAKRNARLNGINDAVYYAGSAEVLLPELLKKGISADAAVIDPPRGGCERELLEAVSVLKIGKLVYVSCNPSTLARDCKILCDEFGWSIREVTPIDMFPNTEHCECIALLKRK